jgi:hypothetical protein
MCYSKNMNENEDFARELFTITTEYCDLRFQRVVRTIGIDAVAEATQEAEITSEAVHSLSLSELDTYFSNTDYTVGDEAATTSLDKLIQAEEEFDDKVIKMLRIDKPLGFRVEQGYLSLHWVDSSKKTAEEMVNLIRAKLTASGTVEITKRGGGPTPSDEAKIRNLLTGLADAIKNLK